MTSAATPTSFPQATLLSPSLLISVGQNAIGRSAHLRKTGSGRNVNSSIAEHPAPFFEFGTGYWSRRLCCFSILLFDDLGVTSESRLMRLRAECNDGAPEFVTHLYESKKLS